MSGRTPGRSALGEAIETGARSTNALGLVEEALRQAQLDRTQIECLAIGLGPGSYNGIRTGHRAGARLATGAPGEAPGHQHRRMSRRPGPGRRDCRARPGRD